MLHLFINDFIDDVALVPVFLRCREAVFYTLPRLLVIKAKPRVCISGAVFVGLAVAGSMHSLDISEPLAELPSLIQPRKQTLLSQVFQNDLTAWQNRIVINCAVLPACKTFFLHIFLITIVAGPEDKAGVESDLVLKLGVFSQTVVEVLPILNKI